MNLPSWGDILLKFLPLDVSDDIREDMADVFAAGVREYEPADDAFSSMSVPDLQDWVKDKAADARDYDPHGEVDELQEFVDPFFKFVQSIVVLVLVISGLSSGGIWFTRSRGLLDALGAISQPLLTIIKRK